MRPADEGHGRPEGAQQHAHLHAHQGLLVGHLLHGHGVVDGVEPRRQEGGEAGAKGRGEWGGLPLDGDGDHHVDAGAADEVSGVARDSAAGVAPDPAAREVGGDDEGELDEGAEEVDERDGDDEGVDGLAEVLGAEEGEQQQAVDAHHARHQEAHVPAEPHEDRLADGRERELVQDACGVREEHCGWLARLLLLSGFADWIGRIVASRFFESGFSP